MLCLMWVTGGYKKSPGAFSSDFRIDSIFPGSGGCFCSVGIYHLCSRGDHIQSQRMSCRYHDIDHKYPSLDILAQTNVLPFAFLYSVEELSSWRYEIVPRFIYVRTQNWASMHWLVIFVVIRLRSHFELCLLFVVIECQGVLICVHVLC